MLTQMCIRDRSHVDHTLLKPEATWPQIQTLCDEAIANHTASVLSLIHIWAA